MPHLMFLRVSTNTTHNTCSRTGCIRFKIYLTSSHWERPIRRDGKMANTIILLQADLSLTGHPAADVTLGPLYKTILSGQLALPQCMPS